MEYWWDNSNADEERKHDEIEGSEEIATTQTPSVRATPARRRREVSVDENPVSKILAGRSKWKRAILIIMKEILGTEVTIETRITSEQLNSKMDRFKVLTEYSDNAKTPGRTLAAQLQNLRDMELIDFIDNNGLYKLNSLIVQNWNIIP